MSEHTTPPDLCLASSGHGEIDYIVTRRKQSLFQGDLNAHSARISAKLRGRRVLVIGGGGSIGSATTRLLVDYAPRVVHVTMRPPGRGQAEIRRRGGVLAHREPPFSLSSN